MSEIKIEKGVPIPTTTRQKYPFADMQVGDSFTTPSSNVYNSIRHFIRSHPDTEFTVRKESEKSWRVWRTK